MTLAQLLFKATAGSAPGRSLRAALPVFFRQPSFYAAMATYAGATVLWLWLLTKYSLAQAYPFTALAFLLVPLVETLFFRVRASRMYWVGLALIIIGAAIVGRARVG
jgi:undecaprenyl phosphate-alpha-L-ara4N flippase subunit ArnE